MVAIDGVAPDPFEPDRLIAHGTRACGLSLDRATAKVLTGTSVTLKWLPLRSQRRRRCEQLSHSRPCYRIADGSSCLKHRRRTVPAIRKKG